MSRTSRALPLKGNLFRYYYRQEQVKGEAFCASPFTYSSELKVIIIMQLQQALYTFHYSVDLFATTR